jgi:colicin import membrane protein
VRDGRGERWDPEEARRRALRRWLWVSALVHAAVLAVLTWAPLPRRAAALPGVVDVELVALAAPAASVAREARASPPPPPRPVPEPKPVAEAPIPDPPKPASPRPVPPRPEAVLPKKPERPPEPTKPRERAKADPKPEPRKPEPKKPEPARPQTPPAPVRPAQETYDDVLADLRAERGESRPEPVARPTASRSAAAPGAPGVPGAAVDAQVAAWLRAARRHVELAWVLPPGFQRERLQAVVRVSLDAGGHVRAQPRVVTRSGNPWYDESVVRAIQKASPLPPPPEAGEWEFEFRPPGGAG